MALSNLLHKKYLIPILFFTAFLVVGFTIVNDYGISWDEEWQHVNAEVSAKYVNEWFPFTTEKITDWELTSYWNRHHGVLFTLSSYFLERALGYSLDDDYTKIYLLRHQLVFLLFWLGCIVFYQIGKLRFKDWRLALAASLLLILSPRIFGHAFFNPKDIVVLAFYVFSTFTFLGILQFKKWYWGILHAITCAMLISSRIAGVIVPVLTVLFVIADIVNQKGDQKLAKKYGLILVLFLPLLFGFTVGFWPLLWKQPLVAFAEVFKAMSAYAWEGRVLLHGQFFPAGTIPWYYIPLWIAITIPVLYLVFGIFGMAFILWQTIHCLGKWRLFLNEYHRTDLVLLALFLGPPLAVIYKGSVVYDGWRHLYFIYPALLMIALLAFQQFYLWLDARKDNRIWHGFKRGLLLVTGISMLYTTWFMIRFHPHQNVYFSEFMQNRDQLGQYELDYWGLSYKQGFEALAALDQRDKIQVAYGSYPAELNWRYLPPEIKKRIKLVKNVEEADYYLSNYRHWEHGMDQYQKRKGPYSGEEVYRIMVGRTKIFGIYRVNRSTELNTEKGEQLK